MTIVYRTAGAWGAGKGSNLTPAEVDGNFYDHEGRVAALEATPPTPNNIANITASGSQLTITMDDASTFGPFTMPTSRWIWTGDFADATAYSINDVFSDPDTGSLYIVLIGHTSATPFDPDLLSGGDPVYELVIDAAGLGGGGIAGVVVTTSATINPTLDQAFNLFECQHYNSAEYAAGTNKTDFVLPSNTTIAYEIGTRLWVYCNGNHIHIYGGSGATVYYPEDRDPFVRNYGSLAVCTKIGTNSWVLSGELEPKLNGTEVSTTTHTIGYGVRNSYIRFTHASGCTVTIPPNTDVEFQIGAKIDFVQAAAGAVTLAPGSGVTFNAKAGSTYTTAQQGAVIYARKVAVNTWDVWGEEL